MTHKKLEALIDSLSDSLEIISHNEAETEYVLSLIDKYETHYFQITGKHYSYKDRVPDIFPTKEWIKEMDRKFEGVR